MATKGTLYCFAGKMGAGKSTKAKAIAESKNTILLSEDDLLSQLYPNQIQSFDDYLTFSSRMKPFVHSHVQQLLKIGVNVVMDFPGNTINQRQWFLDIVSEIQADHQLIYLNIDDATCLQQLKIRRQTNPERADFDTEATFNYVSSFFEEPQASEGLNILEIKD